MRNRLAAFAAAILIAGPMAGVFMPRVATAATCVAGPQAPGVAMQTIQFVNLGVRLDDDTRGRATAQGERTGISGRVFWPNGRPVTGFSANDLQCIAAGLPFTDDGVHEGGIVALFIHYPLALDGITARGLDTVVTTALDRNGRFALSWVSPWIVEDGEQEVWGEAELWLLAVDRGSVQTPNWVAARTVVPLDVVITSKVAPDTQ
jgi:hypothetical protein